MRNDVGVMGEVVTTTVPVGTPCAFVALYERTVTDVYSYFASRVGDWAATEDLTVLRRCSWRAPVMSRLARHTHTPDSGTRPPTTARA